MVHAFEDRLGRTVIDHYPRERNLEYGFPSPGTLIEFGDLDSCKYLEITQYTDSTNTKYTIVDEGTLHEIGISAWLDRVEVNNTLPEQYETVDSSRRVLLGGLRLLYGFCSFNRQTSSPILPLTESTFRSVAEKLCLPEQFVPLITGSGARAFKKSCPRRLEGNGFSPCFVFRVGIYRPNYYQLALSYDPRTCLTYGIILAKTKDHEFPRLVQMIKQKKTYCNQPLLLANLVIELVIDSNAQRIQAADWRLNELEETMGQHEYVNRPTGDPLEIDFIATTRILNTTSRVLGVERMRLGASILALEMILKEMKELEMNYSSGRGEDERVENDDGSIMITEFSAYQMNACQNLILRAEYQEKRVQAQIAVAYQFMAQKDSKVNISLAETSATIAVESKKDSSSMKAIAVLTMCFLPGTFLAAIFAMPLFNWNGDGLPVIKDGFKYYWAIAIPLTFLVLVMWALAMVLPWNLWLRPLRRKFWPDDFEPAESTGTKDH